MSLIRLDDTGDERIALYFITNENTLFRINEPEPGLFIAESPKVIERALKAGYEAESFLVSEGLVHGEGRELVNRLKDEYDIFVLNDEGFSGIKGFNMAGGMMALMKRKRNRELTELVKGFGRIAVLDDVENPTNVGAIFRSAAALGIEAVVVAKGSADPLYRRAARVSMGTVFSIPWVYAGEDYQGLLQSAGFKTVAMALREDSFAINDQVLKSEPKLAVLMGNEGYGLSDRVIEQADYTVMIPMEHEVDSLNVAGAAAIAFWELGAK